MRYNKLLSIYILKNTYTQFSIFFFLFMNKFSGFLGWHRHRMKKLVLMLSKRKKCGTTCSTTATGLKSSIPTINLLNSFQNLHVQHAQ